MTFATGDKIPFAYDSYGNRIKKTVTQNGTTDVVEYIDGYEYKNNQLKYIAANEGFIKFENNQYHYVYQYKDQVGNVRLTYQDVNKNGVIESTEILNESNYYPFGLKHGYYNQLANNFGNSLLSNESFNGQPSLGDLDANLSLMDFRLYDGALGRFFGIDLLADLFTSHSPYHFAYNNPITFMDPTGLSSEEGGHTDMDVIVINVNPPQLPPLPGIDTRPPYFGNFFQFPGIYDPNNPDWDTELPEMIIDKRDLGQEAKNDNIEDNSGFPGNGRIHVINNYSGDVYFKPEGNMKLNNFNFKNNKAYKMGKKSWIPVDGINVNGIVYKISNGYSRVYISENGNVSVQYLLLFPKLHYIILGGVRSNSPDSTWDELFNIGN